MKVRFAPSPKRAEGASIAPLRDEGIPPEGVRAYLEELGIPRHDVDKDAAKEIVRELKGVGGHLRAVRRALTGRDSGPELWSVLAALPREETLRRVDAAL
jgi:hypothetical protein